MKVKELLADPARWTQGWFARDVYGSEVDIHEQDAVCWCLIGAIYKCYEDPRDRKIAEDKVAPFAKNQGATSIQSFNDSATHAEVMKLLEEADV